MKLTASEEALFAELTKDMDAAKAARFRTRLFDPLVMLSSTDEDRQRLINELKASIRARLTKAKQGTIPSGPPPRTARNSWVPIGDDVFLINAILNRYPEQYRAEMRQDLLRTDIWLTAQKDDPESQRLLDRLYERRQKRLEEALPRG